MPGGVGGAESVMIPPYPDGTTRLPRTPQLSRVNDALQRISEGAYGNCIQCNKPIAAARLKAIPYVETCVKCQEELESKSSR